MPAFLALSEVRDLIRSRNSLLSNLSKLGDGSLKSSLGDFPTRNRLSSKVFCSITVSHFKRMIFVTYASIETVLNSSMNRCFASTSKRYR